MSIMLGPFSIYSSQLTGGPIKKRVKKWLLSSGNARKCELSVGLKIAIFSFIATTTLRCFQGVLLTAFYHQV